jgi:hypothetical protein
VRENEEIDVVFGAILADELISCWFLLQETNILFKRSIDIFSNKEEHIDSLLNK